MTARTVVVTGGASGIGAALARALTPDWDVVVVDRSTPDRPVPGVTYLVGDVTVPDALDRLALDIAERAGGRLHGLVHCAAVGGFGDFVTMARDSWERILTVNLHGTLAAVQSFAPCVADEGRVVLFSSGTAFKGPRGAAAYAASKAGVIGFARCLGGGARRPRDHRQRGRAGAGSHAPVGVHRRLGGGQHPQPRHQTGVHHR